MKWKDFLNYHSETKNAVLLLLIIITLVIVLNIHLSNKKQLKFTPADVDSINMQLQLFNNQLVQQNNKPASQTTAANSQHTTPRYYPQPARTETIQPQNNYTPKYRKTEKLSAGQTILLNDADTAQWKKIPGIGSSYSRRIVNYGQLLGGFVNKNQLLEVYDMTEELFLKIEPFVKQDTVIRKLAVNKLEFRDLLRHPYLNYDQVKVIMDLRRRKGKIGSLNQLLLLDEFTDDDINRLEPYLSFD